MKTPRFLIVDDHPLFLEALQAALLAGFENAAVEAVDSLAEARKKLAADRFDLIMLDLRMPDTAGFDGLSEIRRGWPDTPLAVISALAGTDSQTRIRQMGADGFIHKSQRRQEIVAAVETLLGGGSYFVGAAVAAAHGECGKVLDRLRELTPQQFKVLTQICEAKLNKQIAFELGVAETTIKAHVTSIFKKLGVHSRTQAVLLMQKTTTEAPVFELDSLRAGAGGDVR